MSFWEWSPQASVGERQRAARAAAARLAQQGRTLAPVVVEGRSIAQTFWGTSWCRNLEGYSDYENRLPRGRTYVRNGLVLHLEIDRGTIQALVSGSEVYEVTVRIAPVPNARWKAICRDSAGAIDSLVELLQGRFSTGVMERLCRQETGLFPSPREIAFTCTCPDSASMCKHVAAVLYGTGTRLDTQPALLFRLRGVDEAELVAQADGGMQRAARGAAKGKVLAGADLSALFGVEMATEPTQAVAKKRVAKKAVAKKAVAAKRGATKSPTKPAAKQAAKRAAAKDGAPERKRRRP